MKKLIPIIVVGLVAGCKSTDAGSGRTFDNEPVVTLHEYVEGLRLAAVKKIELVPSETTHLIHREFQLVYTNNQYVSFRADMSDYHGGNGNHSRVYVGTISRKTGKVLSVADFIPKARWSELRQQLLEGAIAKLGGKEHLQGEVEVIENFYYADDGLHFIYNPYEIACGAAGDIEVVVK